MSSGSRTKNRMAKAEQSARTRQAILNAATALFLRDGFFTTTVAAIAAEAGVAVQTLYLSFGGKTAILGAAFDQAIAGDPDPTPLLERDWMRRVFDDEIGPRALGRFMTQATAIMTRTTPLYMVIRSAAADPEVAELLAKNKTERHRHFQTVIAALADKPGFTTQLSHNHATDLLYSLQSEDMYALLVGERGWTPEEWLAWTLPTLEGALYPRELLS
jgi:AcrR family transcriptional regulator